MKYWIEGEPLRYETIKGISLEDNILGSDVLIVTKENNKIQFIEGCDQYYRTEMSKEDAILALLELIEYIKK